MKRDEAEFLLFGIIWKCILNLIMKNHFLFQFILGVIQIAGQQNEIWYAKGC